MTTESAEPTTTDDTEGHHYWPDGLVPVTPQAREFGYVFDVYVTPRIWKDMCVWAEGRKTNTPKRLMELLESCYKGLSKALSVNDDMLYFSFVHWYVPKGRPNAKKRAKTKLGARLLLHPETEEPWLLLFDPEYDFADQLKKGEHDGEPEEDRIPESEAALARPEPGAPVDFGDSADACGSADGPYFRPVEGS